MSTMSTLNLSKHERIDVHASTPVWQLLQEAARAWNNNVSEFLLDAGVTAAAQTLANRHQFVLEDAHRRRPAQLAAAVGTGRRHPLLRPRQMGVWATVDRMT